MPNVDIKIYKQQQVECERASRSSCGEGNQLFAVCFIFSNARTLIMTKFDRRIGSISYTNTCKPHSHNATFSEIFSQDHIWYQ